MELRTTLTILLTAGALALVALLPRTPLVLGWLWSNAERLAAEQGYVVSASRLTGNAWGGVTISDVELSGPGLALTGASARIEYGLLSLLTGRLSVGADLSGVRGQIDPAAFPASADDGGSGPALPLNLHRLTLEDVDLTIAEYALYLPDVSVSEVTVSTDDDGLIGLSALLLTPDGQAQVSGHWSDSSGALELDISHADVAIARHWWPDARSGSASGRVVIGPHGVGLDLTIADGVIEYLDVTVTDISGPVRMRDLIIDSELSGTALGGQLTADITVDIPALNYWGILSGSPRLDEAVPWLGRSLGTDLSNVPATGEMTVRTAVTGWETAIVSGSASASGSLLNLPLSGLQGTFDFSSSVGVTADVQALLASGLVSVQLSPEGRSQPRSLRVAAAAVQLVDLPAASIALDGELTVDLGDSAAAVQPGRGGFMLSGELAGTAIELAAQAHSSDLIHWPLQLQGAAAGQAGAITGQLDLDFGTGTADGAISIAAVESGLLP